MTWRALKAVIVVTLCWATATHLEDLSRWLRMRDMSNPKRYQPPTTEPPAPADGARA